MESMEEQIYGAYFNPDGDGILLILSTALTLDRDDNKSRF